jgi:hypothetical protein
MLRRSGLASLGADGCCAVAKDLHCKPRFAQQYDAAMDEESQHPMRFKKYLPRFSIRQLLAATAFIAVGCVALRSASPTITSASYGILLAVLAGSLLLVIHRQGAKRAFWTGFALCGWLYLLLLMYSWGLDRATTNPLSQRNLFTVRLSTWCHGIIFNRDLSPPPTPVNVTLSLEGVMPGTSSPARFVTIAGAPRSGPPEREFVATAHVLWAVVFALCGGWFARCLNPGKLTGDAANSQRGDARP